MLVSLTLDQSFGEFFFPKPAFLLRSGHLISVVDKPP